jgi:hypothetical protein
MFYKKAVETTNQKGKRRNKTHRPKPENREACLSIGTVLLQSIMNPKYPKYHEKEKQVARLLAVHPPNTVEREHK